MDNIRSLLVMAILMISYLLWEQWQIDYGPKPPALISDTPSAAAPAAGASSAPASQVAGQVNAPAAAAADNANVIRVKTDTYAVEIDLQGGTLRNLDLLQYTHEKENTAVEKAYALVGLKAPAKDLSPVRLFDANPGNLFLAQNGLVASDGSAAPDHHAQFQAEKQEYVLAPEEASISVPLVWTDAKGLRVVKTYTFTRDSYVIGLEQKVINDTDNSWSGRQYEQLLRVEHTDKNSNFIRTFSGGVVYTEQEKFKKVKFSEMEDNLNISAQGGWSGMIQHYFANAWIPPADQENHFYTKELNDSKYVIGSYSQDLAVAPHSEGVFSACLFSGPKIQPVLAATAPGLDLTVDYSWLTFIAKYIYKLLNFLHSYIGNWGVAIMCTTLFIKLLFFKLSKASFQSMAKMRKIQPRLKELQERYADDKQRFNTEMMSMYKRERVNPLGGCLPMVVQIPVFISLYWVLIETVELRQADFALWIQDLSAQDPFYLLPVLYGITMKIQQGLNPAPIDPLQAKAMKMFPIVFTGFFLFFPSGLVLYWICNNSLSILQQWYITKHILAEEDRPKAH